MPPLDIVAASPPSVVCTPQCRFECAGDVYTCHKHGQRHHCGATCNRRYVGRDAQVTCEVTGRVFCSMLAANPHVAVAHGASVGVGNRSAAPKSVRRTREPTRQLAWQCRAILTELLYGWKRKILAQRRKQQVLRQITRQLARQRGGRVAKDVAAATVLQCTVHSGLLQVVEMDEPILKKLIKIIVGVCTSVRDAAYYIAHQNSIHTGDMIIGCCYLMQHGVSYNNIHFVPASDYLCRTLPRASDIRHLGFRVRQVTTGKNHLMCCFRSLSPPRRDRSTPSAPIAPPSPPAAGASCPKAPPSATPQAE